MRTSVFGQGGRPPGPVRSHAAGFYSDWEINLNIMEYTEKEIQVLENIKQSKSSIPQRDLASIVGLSLGMTNSILKRLVWKGLLTIKKINNRNIRYAVTARGLEEISRRSYRYFRRTIKNVVYYRRKIESLVGKIADSSFSGLVLIGTSDLDFIVEHACMEKGIEYVKKEEPANKRIFNLYAESYIPEQTAGENNEGREFLQRLFIDFDKERYDREKPFYQ